MRVTFRKEGKGHDGKNATSNSVDQIVWNFTGSSQTQPQETHPLWVPQQSPIGHHSAGNTLMSREEPKGIDWSTAYSACSKV